MPRRIQSTFTRGPRYSAAAMGDSLTYNLLLGTQPHKYWPEQLAVKLRAAGCAIQARNFGHPGNTSTDMVTRFAQMTRYDVPRLGVIWAGANDPFAPISGATTQANITTMAEALFTAGTSYVVIGNTQYLNFTTGGDTTSAQSATYATLKTFQQAAATALIAAHPGKVAYCDTYAWMRQKIVDGIETQGSNSWHSYPDNQHINDLGHLYVAEAMAAAITAQSGWLDAMK